MANLVIPQDIELEAVPKSGPFSLLNSRGANGAYITARILSSLSLEEIHMCITSVCREWRAFKHHLPQVLWGEVHFEPTKQFPPARLRHICDRYIPRGVITTMSFRWSSAAPISEIHNFLQDNQALSKVRYMTVSGSKISPRVFRQFADLECFESLIALRIRNSPSSLSKADVLPFLPSTLESFEADCIIDKRNAGHHLSWREFRELPVSFMRREMGLPLCLRELNICSTPIEYSAIFDFASAFPHLETFTAGGVAGLSVKPEIMERELAALSLVEMSHASSKSHRLKNLTLVVGSGYGPKIQQATANIFCSQIMLMFRNLEKLSYQSLEYSSSSEPEKHALRLSKALPASLRALELSYIKIEPDSFQTSTNNDNLRELRLISCEGSLFHVIRNFLQCSPELRSATIDQLPGATQKRASSILHNDDIAALCLIASFNSLRWLRLAGRMVFQNGRLCGRKLHDGLRKFHARCAQSNRQCVVDISSLNGAKAIFDLFDYEEEEASLLQGNTIEL